MGYPSDGSSTDALAVTNSNNHVYATHAPDPTYECVDVNDQAYASNMYEKIQGEPCFISVRVFGCDVFESVCLH